MRNTIFYEAYVVSPVWPHSWCSPLKSFSPSQINSSFFKSLPALASPLLLSYKFKGIWGSQGKFFIFPPQYNQFYSSVIWIKWGCLSKEKKEQSHHKGAICNLREWPKSLLSSLLMAVLAVFVLTSRVCLSTPLCPNCFTFFPHITLRPLSLCYLILAVSSLHPTTWSCLPVKTALILHLDLKKSLTIMSNLTNIYWISVFHKALWTFKDESGVAEHSSPQLLVWIRMTDAGFKTCS